jgi:hypothetical protein
MLASKQWASRAEETTFSKVLATSDVMEIGL